MVGFEPSVPQVTTVSQAIDTEEDIASVLSPQLISNSPSVGLEPKETSVIHNSPSPRRLFASATANWSGEASEMELSLCHHCRS